MTILICSLNNTRSLSFFISNQDGHRVWMRAARSRWCPPSYKWIIIPLTIDISPINHSEIGLMFTNLAFTNWGTTLFNSYFKLWNLHQDHQGTAFLPRTMSFSAKIVPKSRRLRKEFFAVERVLFFDIGAFWSGNKAFFLGTTKPRFSLISTHFRVPCGLKPQSQKQRNKLK